jgi:hypothetical protein
MDQINSSIIQLREADCGSRTNGDYECVLDKPINVRNGDQLAIKGSFIDIKTTASTSITITEDVHTTIGTVLYGFDHDPTRANKIDIGGTAVGPGVFPTGKTFMRCQELLHPTTVDDPNNHLELVESIAIDAWLVAISPFVQDRYEWHGEPLVYSYVSPVTNQKTTVSIAVPFYDGNTKSATVNVGLLITKTGGFTLVSGTSSRPDRFNYEKATPNITACTSESNYLPMVDTTSLVVPKGVYKPADLGKLITDKLSLSFPTTTVAVPGVQSNFLTSSTQVPITTNPNRTFACTGANFRTYANSTDVQVDVGAAFWVVGSHFKLSFSNPKPTTLNGIPIALLDGKIFEIVSLDGTGAINFNAPVVATSSGLGSASNPMSMKFPAKNVMIAKDGSRHYGYDTSSGQWLGANQIQLGYDEGQDKMYWSTHFPMYKGGGGSDAGDITTQYVATGSDAAQFFVANKHSGVLFSELSPSSFWSDVLGFDLEVLCPVPASTSLTVPGLGNDTVPVYSALVDGQQTSGGFKGLDQAVIKSAFPAVPSASNLITASTSNAVVSMYAGQSQSVLNRLNFAYFLIEIEGLMRTEFVGETVFKNSVRGWVNKYYVNSSYASADGGSSIAYRHAGTPTTIGSLRVRILDPDGTMATVGPDNTVFVELIPAPPQPKALKGGSL